MPERWAGYVLVERCLNFLLKGCEDCDTENEGASGKNLPKYCGVDVPTRVEMILLFLGEILNKDASRCKG